MLLDILFLFQDTSSSTGCFWCYAAWLFLPFLLGLGIGYWIWGAYKDLVVERDAKIARLKKELTEREKESIDLKYKLESAATVNEKFKLSLSESMETNAALQRKITAVEASASSSDVVSDTVKEAVSDTVTSTTVTETSSETAEVTSNIEAATEVTSTAEEVVEEATSSETIIKEVESTEAIAPAAAAAVTLAAVGASSTIETTTTTPAIEEKEDDYLPCKEYKGHAINDTKNNVAFFKHNNGQFYFVLYASNGEVRLRSEGFTSAKERDQELSGVVRFKDKAEMYKRIQKGKYYMDVLYDETGREVGRSCLLKEVEVVQVSEPSETVSETIKPVEAIAAASTVAAVAASSPAAPKDKEDDYLPCREYEGYRINDKRNNIAFFKHENGQYYFAWYAADGTVKLRSEGFPTSQERDKELSGVVRFKEKEDMYKRIQKGKYYMDVLYDETGREVGRSCLQKEVATVAEPTTDTSSTNESSAVENVVATTAAATTIAAVTTPEPAAIEDKEDDYLPCKAYQGHPVNDKRNNIAFFKHENGQYYFAWYAADGAVKLRSEGFRTSQERDKELSGVVRFKEKEDMYKRIRKGTYFMDVLYDETGREVGRSCLQKEAAPVVDDTSDTTTSDTATIETPERQIIKIKRTVNVSGLEDLAGLDTAAQTKLTALGYGSMTSLAAADEATLSKQFAGSDYNWRYWWTQSKYATSGEWAKYYAFQETKGQETVEEKGAAATDPITSSSPYSLHFSNDNLQIIEGVGPKIEKILRNAGYSTWGILANANYDDLKKMLSEAGPRYRIHDPKTWSQQARYANEGKWTELVDYQKQLDISAGADNSYSKVEKLLNKNLGFSNAKFDDLKIVEGIGPKIEGLLKAGGINNWRDLSNASVDKLKLILLNAGNRYRLADPTTWPTQAGMAHRKEWTKLKEYQDVLQGGKDLS